jgi:hypothetical protein
MDIGIIKFEKKKKQKFEWKKSLGQRFPFGFISVSVLYRLYSFRRRHFMDAIPDISSSKK